MAAIVDDAASSQQNTTRKREPSGPGTLLSNPFGVTARPALPQSYTQLLMQSQVQQALYNSNMDSDQGFTKIKPRNGKESSPVLDKEASSGAVESSTRSFVILGLIFLSSIGALGLVYLSFPEVALEDKQHIKLPRDIEDAKNLGRVLDRYKETNYFQVLCGYFITYIFLQSFAIPGSIFLSIIAGYLFPFPLALFLVCLCSGMGASFCYLLSFLVGKRLVYKYLPERAAAWSATVQRHREHLFNYIIFLRITPFLPNWFINIVSPVINVPLTPFFMGTFFGVMPPSFVAIQAGQTLHKLTSSSDTLSMTSVIVLALFALLSLLPVFFKRRLQQKFE